MSVKLNISMSSITRSLFLSLGFLVQLSALYLGIALLVVAGVALALPPARDQIHHFYGTLAASLQTEDYQLAADGVAAMSSLHKKDPNSSASGPSVMQLDELTWSDKANEIVADEVVKGERVDVPHLNFTQALVESEEESSIPGVSKAQAKALRNYIARKYKIANSVAGAIVSTVFTVGREKDLDPQLLLAVIAIESRYNPYAESHVGAQGLMQVMTRVHKDKFEAFGQGPLAAIHPLANIQVGTQILANCLERRGSIDGALACYVGATGPSDGGYGAKVKAEWRRIALASGIPIESN